MIMQAMITKTSFIRNKRYSQELLRCKIFLNNRELKKTKKILKIIKESKAFCRLIFIFLIWSFMLNIELIPGEKYIS